MAKSKKTLTRKGSKKKQIKADPAEELKNHVISGLQEKKAKEIVCIDLRNIKNAVTDFFVICHAESRPHVEAIADSVEEHVFKETGEWPAHKEGVSNAEWILLDYVHVVAHIFREDQRNFYGIERLWADAEIQHIANNF